MTSAAAGGGGGAGVGLAAASGAGTVLTLFWKLAEVDPNERLSASSALIDILSSQQQGFVPPTTHIQHPPEDNTFPHFYNGVNPTACSDQSEARADRIIDHTCTPDLSYSLRRLIRGLASPRLGARQGFAVALTELLSSIVPPSIGADVILTLILRATTTSRSAKPSEARELLFARIFAIHALIRSRLLFRDDDDVYDEEAEEDGAEEKLPPTRVMRGSNLLVFLRTIDVLIQDVATRKSWIRPTTTWLILQAINGLTHIESADLSWRDEAIQGLVDRIFLTPDDFANPLSDENGNSAAAAALAAKKPKLDVDSLAIIIGLSPLLPPERIQALLCPPLPSPHLLSPKNLPVLARILKELPATTPEDENELKSGAGSNRGGGSWNPDLHLIWDQLLDIYYPPSSVSIASPFTVGAAPFTDFVRIAIDESLFAPTASPERKSWGFSLIQNILARLSRGGGGGGGGGSSLGKKKEKAKATERIADVPLLFQPNFMRTWINQLSDPSRILHKTAKKTTTRASPEERTVTSLSLMTTLLTPPLGIRSFDTVTKTKTVEGILATLDGSGLDQYVDFLEAQILDLDAEHTAVNDEAGQDPSGGQDQQSGGRRKWAIDQLLGVVRFRGPAASLHTASGGATTEDADASQDAQQAHNANVLKDEAVVLRVLRFLATHGFFVTPSQRNRSSSSSKKKQKKSAVASSAPSASFDSATRALLRSRLLSSLQELVSRPTLRLEPDGKKHRVLGVVGAEGSGGELWVGKVWDEIAQIGQQRGWASVAAFGSEEAEEEKSDPAEFEQLKQKAEVVLTALGRRRVQAEEQAKKTLDRTDLERIRGLEGLLTGTLLYMLDSPADAAELLEPLADAITLSLATAETIVKKNKNPKVKLGTAANEDAGVEAADEAFVDAILNLLNRPSAFLRSLATKAFGACSDWIGDAGLALLFEALVPSEGDDVVEEEDEDEEMQDVEEDGGDADEDGDEEEAEEDSEEAESSSSETSADSEPDDAEVDPELRNKVFQALQASGIADKGAQDQVNNDDDDSDAESDVTMLDDEQMMKLDDQLATIFKLQAKGKKTGADEHKEAVAQQNKVLELLDAYATRQAGSPNVMAMVQPLLTVIVSADKESAQVANRAAKILRSRLGTSPTGADAHLSNGKSEAAASLTRVHEIRILSDLEEVHKAACEVKGGEHIPALVNASAALVRFVPRGAKGWSEVHRIHLETLQRFFGRPIGNSGKKTGKPKKQFVEGVLQRLPAVTWELRKDLLEMFSTMLSAPEDDKSPKQLSGREADDLVSLVDKSLVTRLSTIDASATEKLKFVQSVNEQSLALFRQACELLPDLPALGRWDANAHPAVFRKIVNLVAKLVRMVAKGNLSSSSTAPVADIFDVSNWQQAQKDIAASAKLGKKQGLLTQVQQLISLIQTAGEPSSGKAKRKAPEPKPKEAPSTVPGAKDAQSSATQSVSTTPQKKKRSREAQDGTAAPKGDGAVSANGNGAVKKDRKAKKAAAKGTQSDSEEAVKPKKKAKVKA
ncbi:DNA-directed DNA polymerase [Tilletia horrida]|uniref:DNA-directed DNA polymerase n=1 Tax=Tilletia horrida TaxID=155126 RepID=A0AAN6GT89_9BASI|nr:DNA-directed DNA polymerase [Tilletia horrida]KAK0569027.1 DNA-directed DNA polymerase [Tilletia horrida]